MENLLLALLPYGKLAGPLAKVLIKASKKGFPHFVKAFNKFLKDESGYIGKSVVVASKSNYRKLYLDKYPGLPKGWQVHHTLPQKYESIMKNAEINIHEVKYLKGVDPDIHKLITKEWSNWDKSLGRNPTAKEVISFAKKIEKKYGRYWYKK